MKPSSSFALAATLLLHAALFAVAMFGFSHRAKNVQVNVPDEMTIEVQLLSPEPAYSAPIPAMLAKVNKSHDQPVLATAATEVAVETKSRPENSDMKTSVSQFTPIEEPTPAEQSTPVQQQPSAEPVINTGASVNASYVATEAAKWYPPLSRKYEEEGAVLLRVNVLMTGHCAKVELKKSSNYPLLDEAAMALAKSLTYHPAIVNGNPVSDWVDFPVVFKLSMR
jgi:protein TonB